MTTPQTLLKLPIDALLGIASLVVIVVVGSPMTNREREMRYFLIDDPPRYGPVEPWMRHLTMLRNLPPDTLGKEQMIEHARQVIVEKRGGQDNVIAFADGHLRRR